MEPDAEAEEREWVRAAYEQYDLRLPLEAEGYWSRNGAKI